MRLRRIDAVRFGALEGSCLADLGDGLTIVFGPNESGKSTYTALVRHVLFGFPMGRGKAGDRFYRPVAGDRAARLVFADATGEWAIDRVEGKKGGPVTVTALRGPQRPELLSELVGELTEQAYRVVFGFGLADLGDIENGGDPHLGARLYAAGTGLDVNPLDVRAAIEKSAADLFAPRARVSAVNARVAQMKEVTEAVRALEAQASAFADEQERARRLAEELRPLRARRDELDAHVRGLERDAQRAEALSAAIEELTARGDELRDLMARHEREIAQAPVEERVAEVEGELGAVLEELSGFRQRLEALRSVESALSAARGRLSESGELPPDAVDSVEARTHVDAWVARRGALEGELRAAERQAEQAEARAREFAAPAATAPGRRPALAIGTIVLGVVFVAAGLVMRQTLAAVLGAAVALAGVAFLVLRPTSGRTGDLSGEVARAAAEARAARSVAETVRRTLDIEDATWRAWIAERSLDAYRDDPVAVRTLLDALRTRSTLATEVARLEADATRERAAATAWSERVVALSRGLLELSPHVGLEETLAVAAQARAALEAARDATDRRTRATEALAGVRTELETASARIAQHKEALAALTAAHDVAPDEAVSRLEALAASAREALAELRESVEARSDELSGLRGMLDNEGRDAAMAVARQQLEGLRSRAQAAADRYVVDALAVRLLDRARERFELERQPEVTRVAGRVLRSMTQGRYTDVRVPLDGAGISVVTDRGLLKPSDELSRGTVEQLYLALRVGFLASLKAGRALPVLMDDVVVNFDEERRAGAAAAIAELARDRQVVFFTCHAETAAVLAAAVPEHTAIALDRCELKG